ncbi:hypothetical protein KAX17_01575 [Candidatus Bipolaricaulota bacterium]|nr:hypothetical protein [Candidatus Bipolaricaulota bacterium]
MRKRVAALTREYYEPRETRRTRVEQRTLHLSNLSTTQIYVHIINNGLAIPGT